MNHKKMVLIFALMSVCLVILGYAMDNDEPYANVWNTVFEFSWLTAGLFAMMAVCYGLIVLIFKLNKQPPK
jgi:hypothetical protein